VVDVREPAEQAVSMIPGAIPATTFEAHPEDYAGKEVVAYCTIGYRSGQWAKAWRAKGVDVRNLKGSLLLWTHAGGALVHDGAPTLAEIQREANHLVEYQEVVGLTEEEDTDWVDPPEGFTERHMQLDQEAWELEDQGDYEGAAERFAQLAEELPRSLLGPLGQAGALMRLGRYDEAIEVLRHALYDIEGGERTVRELGRLQGEVVHVVARGGRQPDRGAAGVHLAPSGRL
ncbi:MAG: tetratricopeptide repeat protein, partial [Myxococcales bacterium]|nr:tetratricopeptide repeat protein [Myxococcales bacterium]